MVALILALLTTSLGFSQTEVEAEKTQEIDTWRPFVSTFVAVPMMSVELTAPVSSEDPAAAKDKSVSYSPETNPDLGVAVDFGPLSAAVSFPITLPRDEEDEKDPDQPPDSKYWDTKFSYARGLFQFEIGAHRYQGFTLEEADDALPEYRHDLVKRGRYANVWFYPMGADFDLGQRAGEAQHTGFRWTPVAQAYYERLDLSGSEPLVPEKRHATFGSDGDVRAITVEATGLAAGGAVKYGESDWQTDFAMTFGRSLDRQEMVLATRQSGRQDRRRMGRRMSLRVGGDYLLDRWNFGMAMMLDQTTTPLQEGQLEAQLGVIQVSAGTSL